MGSCTPPFDTTQLAAYNLQEQASMGGINMQYNVAQLIKEGIGASRHYDIVGDLYDIDANNPGPVHVEGDLRFLRTIEGILAVGKARATLRFECRRCLEMVEAEITFEFEEEYVPSIDVETGVKLPVGEDYGAEVVIDEHHILDLSEVLRQYTVTTTAELDLCRPDCKGLCPECGVNRNIETCTCDLSRVDPRFAALAKLLDHDNGSNPYERDEG